MKRKTYQVASPASFVVLMVAVLTTVFFATAYTSFAAAGEKKSSTVARTTAVEHTETLIKNLQTDLKITEAQKPLWNNLVQVMRENAKEMDVLTKDKREKLKTMNAVEHMKFHNQITEARLAQMKKFLPPFEALYNSMSDEQKKSTDAIFKTGRHGKHRK